MAFFVLECRFENELHVKAIYFQRCSCRYYEKGQMTNVESCIVAMETKNNIFLIKMQTSKFHLSNDTGLLYKKIDRKGTKLQIKK